MSATMTDETTAAPAGPEGTDAGEGRSRLLPALVAMVVLGLGLAAFIVFVANDSEQPAVDPITYTIGPDDGAGLTTGEVDDIVPPIVRLQPNQELVVVNNDWQPHTLGDLQAEQGDTVKISYPSEGRHVTATTLRHDGRLTILVEDT